MAGKSPTVFRVKGLPKSLERKEAQEAIGQTLGVSKQTVNVRSLARDPIRPDQQIATIDFTQIPKCLSSHASNDQFELSRRYRYARDAVPVRHTEDNIDADGESSTPEHNAEDATHLSEDPAEENQGSQLSFDKHFIGFTPLHTKRSTASCNMDIIALSGLNGHAFGSFKQQGGSFMWLRDALPEDMPKARIFTYGYNTRTASNQSVIDLSKTFLATLATLRGKLYTTPPRRLVLIGHSMGGLIIKDAITRMISEHASLFDALSGVVFFGVPGRGIGIPDLEKLVDELAVAPLADPLGTNNSPFLEQLDQFFGTLRKRARTSSAVQMYCFYETMESPTPSQKKKEDGTISWEMRGPPALLVRKESATSGFNDEETLPINKTHSGLVKFSSKDDQTYTLVLSKLEEIRSVQTKFQKDCLMSLVYKEQKLREDMAEIQPADSTCDWLFEDSRFRTWQRSSSGLIWILGPPGCGKSTLMKHAFKKTQKLQASAKDVVAAFFIYRQGGKDKDLQNSPVGLYRYLLYQIMARFPTHFHSMTKEYCKREKKQGKKWSWDETHLRDRFFEILRSLRSRDDGLRVTIFIDALDEMERSQALNLIRLFQDLMSQWPNESDSSNKQNKQTDAKKSKKIGGLKLCLSCRLYPILVNSPLELDRSIQVHERNQGDIKKVVEHHHALSSFSEEHRSLMKKLVLEKAKGIFQWVTLVMEGIEEGKTNGWPFARIQNELMDVPSDLERLYRYLLLGNKKTKSTERRLTVKLFQWIMFAGRPLTYGEFRDALLLDSSMQETSFANFDETTSVNWYPIDRMKTAIHDISKGLATVTGVNTVVLVHQSVSDYLEKEGGLQELMGETTWSNVKLRAEEELCLSCVKYLLLEDVRQRSRNTFGDYRLANYASRFWTYHCKKIDDAKKDQDILVRLLPWNSQTAEGQETYYMFPRAGESQPRRSLFPGMVSQDIKRLDGAIDSRVGLKFDRPDSELIHCMAWFGMGRVLNKIYQQDPSIFDRKDDTGRYVLIDAVLGGDKSTLELAMKNVKPEHVLSAPKGTSALVVAMSTMGDGNLVGRFLDICGTEGFVDTYEKLDYPLHRLCDRDDREDILRLVLERAESMDLKKRLNVGPNRESLLLCAARTGRKSLIQLMLDAGALDLAASVGYGKDNTLHWACSHGKEEIVAQILDHAQKTKHEELMTAPSEKGETPVQFAARAGFVKVIQDLLRRGISISVNELRGILYEACRRQHSEVVKLMLEYSQNDPQLPFGFINFKNKKGQTILDCATAHRDVPTMRLLYEYGATCTWKKYGDLLVEACDRFDPLYDLAECILEQTKRVGFSNAANTRAPGQKTLLWLVAESGIHHTRNDSWESDDDWDDDGIAASDELKVKMLKLLLSHSADPREWDSGECMSPLRKLWEMKSPLDASAECLLDWTDDNGSTLLMCMIRKEPNAVNWGPPLCKQIVDADLHNLDTQDNNGDTLLSYAVQKRWGKHLTKVLLKLGVDPNVQNKQGRTPLMKAAERKLSGIVWVLLECERVNVTLKDKNGRTAEAYAPGTFANFRAGRRSRKTRNSDADDSH
ncbi:hypothetical protein BCR34DRAFT_598047 [Clohesyomyces aquaticus]|uniref:Nephrocystin 3-like N-terminal domain-containing protein n=1 Tax=Clohesyomyces aquaticus TaxID=1231657 RepID=A0A1Y2A1Y6_9PLEO|nr:hypothetical protein BCR34DRAFT_598047 [Clohesyomyces aquaticus]